MPKRKHEGCLNSRQQWYLLSERAFASESISFIWPNQMLNNNSFTSPHAAIRDAKKNHGIARLQIGATNLKVIDSSRSLVLSATEEPADRFAIYIPLADWREHLCRGSSRFGGFPGG
jgi:hypothetical protein